MELVTLLNLRMRRPFRTFHLRLSERSRMTITHPESVSIYMGGLGFWRLLPSGQIEFIEGDAVVALQSADVADAADFPSVND